MNKQEIIDRIKNLVSQYGVEYDETTDIDLANQEIDDDGYKTVTWITVHTDGKLTADINWYDEETDEDKEYPAYPVSYLPESELENLLNLVEFAVADQIEAEEDEDDE